MSVFQENAVERREEEARKRLVSLIPSHVLISKLRQYGCELEEDYLGFVEVYDAVSRFIPTDMVIADFGCYMAAQAYFFQKHKSYIGVDSYDLWAMPNLERFCTKNSVMLKSRIQDVIRIVPQTAYAVCAGVPDFEASDMVRKNFPNHCVCYPGRPSDITGIHADEIRAYLNGKD